MTAFAVARLTDVKMGPKIVTYLGEVDAALAPFEGKFIIHGSPKIELEGRWPDDLIVIAFPSLDAVRAWYDSPAYREILPLRTNNSSGVANLIEGVDAEHRAWNVLS